MKLVKLQCPNCNSILEVNEEMKQFTCNYCGTITLLDDEVIRVKHYNSKLDDILNEIEEYYDNGNYEKCIDIANKYINEYPLNKKIKKIRSNSAKKVIKKYYSSDNYIECLKMFKYLEDYSLDKDILNIYNEVSRVIRNQKKHDDWKSGLFVAFNLFLTSGVLFFLATLATINIYSKYHNFTHDEASFIFPQLIIYGIVMLLSLFSIVNHIKNYK